ncbi:N-acetylmuramoyl-L-alanine amidase [Acidimicrobiia bacterium]|nr:N-acetylmuramoyl-L-alanine amidase [Acidimicrobiia bacterium]
MPIRQRTAIANALSPKVFVSIHHNGGAVRRSEVPGTETFHQINNSESQRLAGLLFEEVFESFKSIGFLGLILFTMVLLQDFLNQAVTLTAYFEILLMCLVS